jgi:hypothetical protein
MPEASKLDSSLKRHTALIKRMRLSMGADNHDQIIKDIDALSLEKYVDDEIVGASVDGIARCKTEKDVWCAVEVRCRGDCVRNLLTGFGAFCAHAGRLMFTPAISDDVHTSSDNLTLELVISCIHINVNAGTT